MCRQNNNTNLAIAQGFDRDLFAHHKGIVHARSVTDAQWHWQEWCVEI